MIDMSSIYDISELLGDSPTSPDHPAPAELVTCEQFGVMVGVSARAVRSMCERDIIRRVNARIEPVQALLDYCKHLREAAAARTVTSDGLTAERVRETRARAEKIEIRNAKEKGELVSAAEVRNGWAEILRLVRSQMLAIPARAGQVMPHLTAEDRAKLDHLIRNVLQEASGHDNDA